MQFSLQNRWLTFCSLLWRGVVSHVIGQRWRLREAPIDALIHQVLVLLVLGVFQCDVCAEPQAVTRDAQCSLHIVSDRNIVLIHIIVADMLSQIELEGPYRT